MGIGIVLLIIGVLMIGYPYFARFERVNEAGVEQFDGFTSAAETTFMEGMFGLLGFAFIIGGIVEFFGK